MLIPDEIFSANGLLARHLPGFSFRPQQHEMAESIAQALVRNDSLICEAGTGTGKTFAYLVPALLSGRKIIVSTGTKHLQDQLYYRDLPVICKALDCAVNSALLKGRGNYLCQQRLAEAERNTGNLAGHGQPALAILREWSARTVTGDLAELADLPEDSPLRPAVTSTAENCLGQDCAFYDECHVFSARKKANEANLVVVNHHLLMADLSLRETGFGEILPAAETVIFDEAHQLPELAAEFFGQALGSRRVMALINDSLVAFVNDAGDVKGSRELLDALTNALRRMRLAFGTGDARVAWREKREEPEVKTALANFRNILAQLEAALDAQAQRSKSLENCWRRCGDLMGLLDAFLEREPEEAVQWLETKGQGFSLHLTPLDVSGPFQLHLSEYSCNCIFTSATLAAGEDFSHFARQLGLDGVPARSWPSPYDFRRQALLYLPQDMPMPGEKGYTKRVIEAALPVIRASAGRTFLLFTSYRALEEASQLVAGALEYPLFIQGEAPRTQLLEDFRRTDHAVLLGTSSFWEGVDVRGQALSSVIIDKLPFAPPDDPVFRARAARMAQNGINPFLEYQLPLAILSLKQGAGRLIRDISDYGVMTICDPRLLSRSYGRRFLDSLPSMNVTRNIDDVVAFFDRHLHATPPQGGGGLKWKVQS